MAQEHIVRSWTRVSSSADPRVAQSRRRRRRRSLYVWGGWLATGVTCIWLVLVAMGS